MKPWFPHVKDKIYDIIIDPQDLKTCIPILMASYEYERLFLSIESRFATMGNSTAEDHAQRNESVDFQRAEEFPSILEEIHSCLQLKHIIGDFAGGGVGVVRDIDAAAPAAGSTTQSQIRQAIKSAVTEKKSFIRRFSLCITRIVGSLDAWYDSRKTETSNADASFSSSSSSTSSSSTSSSSSSSSSSFDTPAAEILPSTIAPTVNPSPSFKQNVSQLISYAVMLAHHDKLLELLLQVSVDFNAKQVKISK